MYHEDPKTEPYVSFHMHTCLGAPPGGHASAAPHAAVLCCTVLADNVEGEAGNCGCTATAVLVRKDVVIVANVGDSRAVLCRGGQAVDLTVEHRVYGRGTAVKSETQRVLQVLGAGWECVGTCKVCRGCPKVHRRTSGAQSWCWTLFLDGKSQPF